MIKKLLKRMIISLVLTIVALIIAQSIMSAKIYFEKQSNHEKVIKYVTEDLSFTSDSLERDVAEINRWLDKGHFKNEDAGRLYERASLIYMQLGEEMTYYRYLGYALYYLERSPEKDYTVNIYLDLANFHLNNYAYDSAREMTSRAQQVEDFHDIQSIQIKSYAFRMLGIMAINYGDYDKAEEYLNYSQELLNEDKEGIYASAYYAINETWLARVYYEKEQYAKAQAIIDKYVDSPFFTMETYREIMLRDMVIPYYQTKCLLDVAQNYQAEDKSVIYRKDASSSVLEDFIKLCEETGYEKCALRTLLTIESRYPTDNMEVNALMYGHMYQLYTHLFDEQNVKYASIIGSQVNDSKATMEEFIKEKNNNTRRTRLAILSILVLLTVISTFIIIIANNRYDGLTMLFTRKTFNKDLSRMMHSLSEYAIIMIDIDDFKHVNDTYGHPEGDKVLQRLGNILSHEAGGDIKAYRYGGEELVFLLGKNAISSAGFLAERIRQAVEMQLWDFDSKLTITISVGVAKGHGNMDVLKQADENLYYSKQHGKNQVYFPQEEPLDV
ncbi:MAG: diguanylate cyclase [Pseudobutyrivibrio sp.]|nr:diguanylate cyclase [Pseudobutyrivibrio sp.]